MNKNFGDSFPIVTRPRAARAKTAALALVAAVLLPLCAAPAIAQDYPQGPVSIYAPGGIGSLADIMSRLVARGLPKQMKGDYSVSDFGSDNGVSASDSTAKAPPDGYTLLVGNESTIATNFHLKKRFPFDPTTDFTPIIGLGIDHYALVVSPALPVTNAAEFIEYAKKNKVAYASDGVGSTRHLGAALFATKAGFQAVHQPLANIRAITDALAGNQAQYAFINAAAAKAAAGNKRVKILGIADAAAIPGLPDAPPLAAALPGFQFSGWYGLFAPANLPAPVLAKLNAAVGKVVADPDWGGKISTLFLFTPAPATPEEFAAFVKADIGLRGEIVKTVGIEKD